jgi:hypothetical protein
MNDERRRTKDAVAVIALVAIGVLACALLGSLLGETTPPTLGAFIVRASATPLSTETPTATRAPSITATRAPTATPTATPLPRVYLLPLRRVFSIGQTQPQSDAPFLLYETGDDAFQMIAQQGTWVRLQTLDGRINFWTARENVSTIPPAPAEYDDSVRGKTARLAASSFVCLHSEMPAPVFSVCQTPSGLTTARVIAKITAGHIVFYQVEVNGKTYFVPTEGIVSVF